MRATIVFAVVLLPLLSTNIQGANQGDQQDFVLSFDARTELVEGEPLIFRLTMQNRTDDRVAVDLGWDRKGGIFVLANGAQFRVTRPLAGGVSRTPIVQIEPHGTYTQQYVLNEWASLQQPGLYTLVFGLEAPYRTSNGRSSTVRANGTFRVNVSTADPAALQRKCDSLSLEALSGPTDAARTAAQALSFITDSVAVVCIQKVLRATTVYDALLIPALSHIETEAARPLLEEMFRARDEERYNLANDALVRLRSRVP